MTNKAMIRTLNARGYLVKMARSIDGSTFWELWDATVDRRRASALKLRPLLKWGMRYTEETPAPRKARKGTNANGDRQTQKPDQPQRAA